MKRVNNIFDRIVSIDNLKLADKMARKGKKSTYGVELHDRHREANIIHLHEQLKSESYKTSLYKTFIIHEPKEREIFCLPYYPDRIVHWAIMLQLESIWMKVFTTDSFSCIKGRGIHGAARELVRSMHDVTGTRYCLKLDIRKFYPNVNQDILMEIIKRKIKCVRTLNLLGEIIHSTPKGLPIGNYISQFAANLYLTYFDHWIKEVRHIKHYFRYCDDIVLLAETKEELHSELIAITDYLRTNLELELKYNYQIFPVDKRGIDLVGYRFYHDHILLRKGIKKSMMRKRARLIKMGITGKEFKMQMAAYMGWASQDFSSTRRLMKALVA